MSSNTMMLDEQKAAQVLDDILVSALRKRASDVHLEPRERQLRIRFRIDGLLVDQPAVPKALAPAVLGRVKVLASLDVAEKRTPQDGGFTHKSGSSTARYRVSTLPTDFGEKIVLRILSQRGLFLELSRIGMGEGLVERVQNIVQHPNGVVLVTGPTGSGKTSTLYAMLREIDAKTRNVVTLEDPIEIRLPDIVQTQVHPKAGYTFATGLRAILRQDPDVVLVGEMRDRQTADTALKAGLTGHMVFSSLHTNSAIDTFLRLVDMGLDRYVVANALRGVIAQRLVRKLCTECRKAVVPDAATCEKIALTEPHQSIYDEVGCPKCGDTGFHGRTAIFEMIELDEGLADLVKSESASGRDYREHLSKCQIPSLRTSGMRLVREGCTSLKEVLRVT